jgi:hypothetical protein
MGAPPRRRLAIAVAVWALFPLFLAVPAILRGAVAPAVFFTCLAIVPVLIVARVRSPRLAALLLVLLASPFALQFIRGMVFARGAGALAVADSPLGFLVGAVVEVLVFVPLLGFALSIWRRRRETA